MILDERIEEARSIMLSNLPEKSLFYEAISASDIDEFYNFLRVAGIGAGYINNIVSNSVHTNLVLQESKKSHELKIEDIAMRSEDIKKLSPIQKGVFRSILTGELREREQYKEQELKQLIWLLNEKGNKDHLARTINVRSYIEKIRREKEIVLPRVKDIETMVFLNELLYRAKEGVEHAKEMAYAVLKAGKRKRRRG